MPWAADNREEGIVLWFTWFEIKGTVMEFQNILTSSAIIKND